METVPKTQAIPVIKTPADLKAHVESTESHFFDRKTMKFFGDTMANYGLRKAKVKLVTKYVNGVPCEFEEVEAYELYRRKPVKYNNRSSTFWAVADLRRLFPDNES